MISGGFRVKERTHRILVHSLSKLHRLFLSPLSSPYGYFAVCVWRLLLMISTSNFQEWKNVIRQDWKRKTWSRDPTTTVALRVWNFENLTRKVVFLFSFRKWNAQKNVSRSKWGRATVGFYKRITGRVANWRRAYQSPCWTHCAVWSWSNEKPHRE